MVYTQDQFAFLETIQATAADISLNNHVLAITKAPRMDYRQIGPIQDPPVKAVVSVAEVLQITTVTPTGFGPAVVGTVYRLQVVQVLANGSILIEELSYTVQATADDATTVCNAWRAQLATGRLKDTITGSGGATFIMTAVTGSPVFQVNESSALISSSTSPAGVWAVGTTAALTALGIPQASTNPPVVGWVTGHTYTTVTFTYTSDDANRGGDLQKGWSKFTLYVYEGATNYSTFMTRLQQVIGAVTAGGVADPETVAIGS